MLTTRICHDLAGPISATNNGIELMAMESDPEMQAQAVDLLKMSAGESFTKLQMYRMAFGRTQENGYSDLAETQEIIGRYFASTKIRLEWQLSGIASGTSDIPNQERQLIVAALLVAAGVLVFGGALRITRESQGVGSVITLHGSHERLRDVAEINDIFDGKEVEYSPQNAQIYYLYYCLQQHGVKCDVQADVHAIQFVMHFA